MPNNPLCVPAQLREFSPVQRLGKNHGGYHGERIDIHNVLRDIASAGRIHGWSVEVFHRADSLEWLALHRPALAPDTAHPAARIYLSTGIHGDEPAGPLAMLQLLRENRWPANAELFAVPCLNPAGFLTNRRENPQGLDLNRDYLHPQSSEIRAHLTWLDRLPPLDLCLCLHEDWESHGFYVYELNPDNRPSHAAAMVQAVTRVCPIDLSDVIEGRPAHGGIIRPTLDPTTRPQWPEAFWLITHKTRLSYTLEAPSDFPLETRVNALVEAVRTAVL
jgi:protein MpaA